MKQIIKTQSKTIQEIQDCQENITLANKERDEELEEIRKLTESISKNLKKSDEFHSTSSQSSFLEVASDKTIERIKTHSYLSESDKRYMFENQLLGDFHSVKEPMMDRRIGHTGKDLYLVLKALQAGEKCVNFKLDYIKTEKRVGENRAFSLGNSWLSTEVELKNSTRIIEVSGWKDGRTHTEAHYRFLRLNFGLQLPFFASIEISALINKDKACWNHDTYDNNLTLEYAFKNVKLVPVASNNGFFYENKDDSVELDSSLRHASVTWVVKILHNE